MATTLITVHCKLFQMMSYIIKVDRDDHFQRPGFLHIILCVFLGYNVSNFFQKNGCYRCLKKSQNLKGLTVKFVQGLFKQCSHVQIFLQNETLWIALTYYGINFKTTNLDSF